MDSTSAQRRYGSKLLSITGRLLVGYILIRAINSTRASSLSTESADLSSALEHIAPCTPELINDTLLNIQQDANRTGRSENELAQTLFEQCTTDFLVKNPINLKVKQVINEWMGLDLGKVKANQLFWLMELSIQSPKPQEVGDEFIRECKQMSQVYETFRLATEPLAEKIDIQTSEGNDLSDEQRDFLSFALYTRFCLTIVESQV